MPSRARLAPVASAAFALALVASSRPATADDPPKVVAKTASFVWDGPLLRMSVAYRDIIDAGVQQKLASGLPTVIVLRGYVFEDGAQSPSALTAKTCRVAYDPWDEIYRVQLAQPGSAEQTVPVPTIDGVLRRCAEAQSLAVVEYARLKANGRYLVQGLVEVNPISSEMLERIKRWVSRPAGATTIVAGDALFGSFVGLFVARIGTADRQLAFRTQPFVVPATPPPPPPP